MPNDWKESQIWQLICAKTDADHPAQKTLRSCMPDIEKVLADGGTSSLDFTLHDREHSFRVAETIFILMPPEVREKLGPYEMSLLLLAAYLHDIGMTPEKDISQRYYKYICTGEAGLLTGLEIAELQEWLDDRYEGIEVPVLAPLVSVNGLNQAEEIFAYYCRHRHNDWSELWIKGHLSSTPPLYPTWLDDLVVLCRSHHDGLAELREDQFNARLCGARAEVINLRYLAALLRLADVLEFDPERTPDIIMRHRSIAPKSKVFWKKDKEIALKINFDTRQIIFSARTPDAQIHRAVLETANYVDNELLCCGSLNHESAYLRGVIPADSRDYSWPWPSRLTRDIAPKDNSFVYIDGAFRPDQKKILKLLAGTALYGTPLAAVRELLQNAIDAVKEQIAYERLSQDDSSSNALALQLGGLHKIIISVERDAEGVWLTCADDGVGMTRAIIEDHLLVSGSEIRGEVRALERKARTKGFSTGRTGQFGIGVLSYFMIGDRLVVSTRRSAEAEGDVDNTGWRFSIDGLTNFGQLTRINRSLKGSEIRIRIKPDLLRDEEDWLNKLESYIFRVLRYLPCKCEIRLLTRPPLMIGPGWVRSEQAIKETIIENIREPHTYSPPLPTPAEKERTDRTLTQFAEFKESLLPHLRLFGQREGVLSGGAGRYRIALPYICFDGQASLTALNMEGVSADVKHHLDDQFRLPAIANLSWRGFAVDEQESGPDDGEFRVPYVYMDLDLVSGGRITVDRHKLTLDTQRSLILKELNQIARELVADFLKQEALSKFRLVNNERVASISLKGPNPHSLLDSDWCPILFDDGDRTWIPVKFPLVEFQNEYFSYRNGSKFLWNNGNINVAVQIADRTLNNISVLKRVKCDRMAFLKNEKGGIELAAVWEKPAGVDRSGWWALTEFPAGWDALCCINTSFRTFMNPRHKLVKVVIDNGLPELPAEPDRPNADFFNALLAGDKYIALTWVLLRLQRGNDYWERIRHNFPLFFSGVLKLLEPFLDASELKYWSYSGFAGDNGPSVLSARGASLKRYGVSADDLTFPGGSTLELPKDTVWWVVKG